MGFYAFLDVAQRNKLYQGLATPDNTCQDQFIVGLGVWDWLILGTIKNYEQTYPLRVEG